VWIGGWLVLMVLFLVVQQVFYRASRKTHGLWRPASERWLAPSWRELNEMGAATFRKHQDRDAETARRRYLAVMAIAIGWMFLGLPAALLVEAGVRRLLNPG